MPKLLLLLRPSQWVKNAFVFLPLFFHGSMTDVPLLLKALWTFVCFSLTASAVYCFNDVLDAEADRLHPKKRMRPIASGAVTKGQAYGLMAALVALAAGVAAAGLGEAFLPTVGILGFYFVMNIAYCLRLKHIALVDVFIIALGFVLRVLAGGTACDIALSHWIVLMTFLLALFLAFAKRRDDVVIYQETKVKPRKNINRYNLDFMNQAITVVATVTVIAYIMYTVSDEVMARLGSRYVYLTTVFVLLGILRYMQLALVDLKSGSPTRVLLRDRFVQVCIAAWIGSFVVLIYLNV